MQSLTLPTLLCTWETEFRVTTSPGPGGPDLQAVSYCLAEGKATGVKFAMASLFFYSSVIIVSTCEARDHRKAKNPFDRDGRGRYHHQIC